MPRYVINLSSNGHRLFSTSRSSIGMDKSKLQRLTNLFDILVAGAPDEEDMGMEVVLIGDASAQVCTLNGDPLPKISSMGEDDGSVPFNARTAQIDTLKASGWHEVEEGTKVRNDSMGISCDTWDEAIVEVFGHVIGVATLKTEAMSISDPALGDHPTAKANKESWNFTKGGIVKPTGKVGDKPGDTAF